MHECIYIDAYASLDMDGCVCIGAYMHGYMCIGTCARVRARAIGCMCIGACA